MSLSNISSAAMRPRVHGASAGYTLMEIMLTLLIAVILATLATSSYARYVQSAKNGSAANDLRRIKMKIDQYRLNNNDAVPLTLGDIQAGSMRDPWGNPYQYLNFSTVNGNGQKRKDHNLVPINSRFDLYSKGADGQSVGPLTAKKSHDDIIMANDGGYVGLASGY